MSIRNETETIKLRKMVVHEFNVINHLEEKLITYNEDLCMRNDLQIRVNDMQRVLNDVALYMKQTNENHSKKKESISKTLEHFKVKESTLSVNNQRLRDAIDQMNGRIDTLRLGKDNLISQTEKLNECNEYLENELGAVKASSAEELDGANGRLSRQLACLEDECRGARDQTAECRTTVGRLRDKCAVLEAGLERALAAVADARARLAETAGRLELERGELAGWLDAEGRVLRDAEAERADVKRRAADEGRDAAALAAREAELRDVDAALRREAEARGRWLAEDVAAKEAHARRLDEQLAALRRDDALAAEVAAVGRLVRDKAGQLAGARRRAEDERRGRADERGLWARRAEALARYLRDGAAALDESEAHRTRDDEHGPCGGGRFESGDDAGGRDDGDDENGGGGGSDWDGGRSVHARVLSAIQLSRHAPIDDSGSTRRLGTTTGRFEADGSLTDVV